MVGVPGFGWGARSQPGAGATAPAPARAQPPAADTPKTTAAPTASTNPPVKTTTTSPTSAAPAPVSNAPVGATPPAGLSVDRIRLDDRRVGRALDYDPVSGLVFDVVSGEPLSESEIAALAPVLNEARARGNAGVAHWQRAVRVARYRDSVRDRADTAGVAPLVTRTATEVDRNPHVAAARRALQAGHVGEAARELAAARRVAPNDPAVRRLTAQCERDTSAARAELVRLAAVQRAADAQVWRIDDRERRLDELHTAEVGLSRDTEMGYEERLANDRALTDETRATRAELQGLRARGSRHAALAEATEALEQAHRLAGLLGDTTATAALARSLRDHDEALRRSTQQETIGALAAQRHLTAQRMNAYDIWLSSYATIFPGRDGQPPRVEWSAQFREASPAKQQEILQRMEAAAREGQHRDLIATATTPAARAYHQAMADILVGNVARAKLALRQVKRETETATDPALRAMRDDARRLLRTYTVGSLQQVFADAETLIAARDQRLGEGAATEIARVQRTYLHALQDVVGRGEADTIEEAEALLRRRDHVLYDRFHQSDREADDLQDLLSIDTAPCLHHQQNDEGRRRVLTNMADNLRHRTGSSAVAAHYYEAAFAKDLDHATRAIPGASRAAIEAEVRGDVGAVHERVVERLADLKDDDPGQYRAMFPNGEPTPEQLGRMTDEAVQSEIDARMRKLAYEGLAARAEHGTLSDATAARAWAAFEEMADPNDAFFNLSDDGKQAIADEAIVTVATLPVSFGVGTAVRGLAGTATAVRAARVGTVARLAVRGGIAGASYAAEGLVTGVGRMALTGADYDLKMLGMDTLRSFAFHAGGTVWRAAGAPVRAAAGAATSPTARAALTAVDAAGRTATSTTIATATESAEAALSGRPLEGSLAERAAGHAARMIGSHAVIGATRSLPGVLVGAYRSVYRGAESLAKALHDAIGGGPGGSGLVPAVAGAGAGAARPASSGRSGPAPHVLWQEKTGHGGAGDEGTRVPPASDEKSAARPAGFSGFMQGRGRTVETATAEDVQGYYDQVWKQTPVQTRVAKVTTFRVIRALIESGKPESLQKAIMNLDALVATTPAPSAAGAAAAPAPAAAVSTGPQASEPTSPSPEALPAPTEVAADRIRPVIAERARGAWRIPDLERAGRPLDKSVVAASGNGPTPDLLAQLAQTDGPRGVTLRTLLRNFETTRAPEIAWHWLLGLTRQAHVFAKGAGWQLDGTHTGKAGSSPLALLDRVTRDTNERYQRAAANGVRLSGAVIETVATARSEVLRQMGVLGDEVHKKSQGSRQELAVLDALLQDPEVAAIEVVPRSAAGRSSTPDFRITFRDGHSELWDIKSKYSGNHEPVDRDQFRRSGLTADHCRVIQVGGAANDGNSGPGVTVHHIPHLDPSAQAIRLALKR